VQLIQKIAKLFVACVGFALSPFVILFISWLLARLLQCELIIHNCVYLTSIMFVLGVYGFSFTIPISIIFFALKIVSLNLSRKHLIQLTIVIFLSPIIFGITVNIIAFMFRHLGSI
jgi:hypothetical protein